MLYKLNEPCRGFIESNNFVCGAELQNLLKLFEYIMDYPGPAPAIKRRTAQHKQTLSIIY